MAALHATDRNTIYIMLVQFPVVCFTLALLTDIVYWQTSHLMWTEFSAWLLFVGIVTATELSEHLRPLLWSERRYQSLKPGTLPAVVDGGVSPIRLGASGRGG